MDLAGEDNDGDARRESDRHRMRDVTDVCAKPHEADGEQDQPGQSGRQQHAVDAVARDAGGHQHDESTRRSADLEPAAAERRNQKAADNRSVKSAIRRYAGGNRQRHRQRQRDNRNRQSRKRVGLEVRKAIAFAEHADELRRELLGKRRLRGSWRGIMREGERHREDFRQGRPYGLKFQQQYDASRLMRR